MTQKKLNKNTRKKSARPAQNSRPGKKQSYRRRTKRKKRNVLFLIAGMFLLLLIMGIVFVSVTAIRKKQQLVQEMVQDTEEETSGPLRWQQGGAPYIDVQLLTPNEYSRPQIPLEQVNYIAIHYTANPGAAAMANRNYFENLADTHEAKVSSHFVVGLEGEVVQCIPTSEISYATNSRNVDTLSIECCHPDESGAFLPETYDSVVKLTAWLCTRFGLRADQVIRHYDVTGKECPKYYVDHPEAWEQMRADIAEQIEADYVLQENINQQ